MFSLGLAAKSPLVGVGNRQQSTVNSFSLIVNNFLNSNLHYCCCMSLFSVCIKFLAAEPDLTFIVGTTTDDELEPLLAGAVGTTTELGTLTGFFGDWDFDFG